jgi:hypothetical protein
MVLDVLKSVNDQLKKTGKEKPWPAYGPTKQTIVNCCEDYFCVGRRRYFPPSTPKVGFIKAKNKQIRK